MDRDERIEELKAVWGPPPDDPIERSIWEHGKKLLADLPGVVSTVVREQGTDHHTLQEIFGEFLPDLEAEVVWRYLTEREREEVLNSAKDVLGREMWQTILHGRTPVQKTRIAQRLADDVANQLARIALSYPVYRALLIDDGP